MASVFNCFHMVCFCQLKLEAIIIIGFRNCKTNNDYWFSSTKHFLDVPCFETNNNYWFDNVKLYEDVSRI